MNTGTEKSKKPSGKATARRSIKTPFLTNTFSHNEPELIEKARVIARLRRQSFSGYVVSLIAANVKEVEASSSGPAVAGELLKISGK